MITGNYVIKTGRTIQEAVQLAIEELNTDLDQVKIDILEEPAKGLLGFISGKPAKVKVTLKATPSDVVREFLQDLINVMGVEGRVTVKEEEANLLRAEFKGPNMGVLIGRRGQTLDSIQYIAGLVLNKKYPDKYYRVIVDTEDYRKKREETLVQLAKNIAYKAVRLGKDIALEPMNPYERRIIHSALQGDARVTTHSEGEEPYRKVIISVK
ncbi:MAG TPA: RNA-binding cell elongation regulator Jag/EloR [Bacillota bacterium]|nr:RNA-binding cell elongation regulator Jag/EloR [Bacillota bacterium]HQA47027.1 RNA-binding cell elongation regulator Jag/EloR [Bacillota bacterium]HQD41518.1 RNA-binding cell elongation regulator Jag/EloR [Bacillota bacterium]